MLEDLPRSLSVDQLGKGIVKVSPRLRHRALMEPPPALKSLIQGAQLSHYNFLVGSHRSPTKNDHFHSRTYITSFVPSFQASHFAHSDFLWDYSGRPQGKWDLVPANPRIHVPRRLPPLRIQHVPTFKPPPHEPPAISPLPQLTPTGRRVLCLRDGQSLTSAHIPSFAVDFDAFLHRYFAFDHRGYYLPSRNSGANLESQALMEILEQASEALHCPDGFKSVYLVDGRRVLDFMKVPKDCEVLLFSSSGPFIGLRE